MPAASEVVRLAGDAVDWWWRGVASSRSWLVSAISPGAPTLSGTWPSRLATCIGRSLPDTRDHDSRCAIDCAEPALILV